MADDIVLPGTGAVVRSDDVGGVQYQVFKLDVGGNGATLPLSASNPLPSQLVAGAALIGKVGIDQTTAGTTNAVSLAHIGVAGTSISANNGISAAGTLRVTIASDSIGQVASIGKAAAGATISGAPVLNGGAARTANPTAVTDGQVANLMLDKLGKQVVVSALRELVGMQTTTITSSTAETTIVTAIASTFCDLTSLTITNSSATATLVTLKDSTAGTTRAVHSVPANGGLTIPFNPPLPQAAVNTAWTITCGTSVASLYVSSQFVKNI